MICKRIIITSKPAAKTLRSGPGAAKPRNEGFVKGSKTEKTHLRPLAQTLKSGPEVAKPGNYPPGPNSVLVWRVEGKVVSGCRGEGSVPRSPKRIVFVFRLSGIGAFWRFSEIVECLGYLWHVCKTSVC